MNIHEATRAYESWLGSHVRVLKADLALKHERMAQNAFAFLRATYYRWAQLFPVQCPKANGSPKVLAVGDLHVENFGTWRDTEGRLVWGINDFDEAFPLPYTHDLVRLAASARLAIQLLHLSLDPARGCAAILAGYINAIKQGGKPFVLAEHNAWLGKAVTTELRDPVRFWEKIAALRTIRPVPMSVLARLRRAMPDSGLPFRVAHRQAGLGSLGRPRFTAIAENHGSKIARETKPLLPSACVWADDRVKTSRIYYADILQHALRAADPFLTVRDGWVIRRLSPYCSRIELSQLPRGRDEEKLLNAMGGETANIHLGTPGAARRICRDLAQRKPKWLCHTSEIMVAATLQDWKDWRSRRG